MLNISRRQLFVLIGLVAVLSAGILYAQTDWLVSKDPPSVIGVQVATGHFSLQVYPDITWEAPTGGQLQAVFWDNDPKCGEDGAILELARQGGAVESYPVPTAPLKPSGDCNDPVDALYSSRSFALNGGM
jgi:hypothetical protein